MSTSSLASGAVLLGGATRTLGGGPELRGEVTGSES